MSKTREKIQVHGTTEGNLYILPEDLFALKKVQDIIKKAAMKDSREDTQRSHSEEEKFAFRDGWLARNKKVMELEEQNAKLKEALSQLIPIAEERLRRIVNDQMPDYYKIRSGIQSKIDSAKKLLTEEPLNQPHHEKEHKGQ